MAEYGYEREIKPPADPARTDSSTAVAAAAATTATAGSVWEDEQYTYEETVDMQSSDDEEFRPMTDEEMEAELERMDEEFKKMGERFRKEEADKDKGE